MREKISTFTIRWTGWNDGILEYWKSSLLGAAQASAPVAQRATLPEPVFPNIPLFPPVHRPVRRSLGGGGYSNIPMKLKSP